MSAPDLELKKAFGELQSKMIESKQKIKLHDMQIENMKRSIQHSTLTDQEISSLPEGTKVRYAASLNGLMVNSQDTELVNVHEVSVTEHLGE